MKQPFHNLIRNIENTVFMKSYNFAKYKYNNNNKIYMICILHFFKQYILDENYNGF